MSRPTIVAQIAVTDAEQVRVSLDEHRGAPVVDIRAFEIVTAAKVPLATKRGLNIPVELLPQLVAALQQAERQARELGLIQPQEQGE